MPLYEFHCETCNNISEHLMKLTDKAPTECSCGAQNSLKKVISRSNFVLKGTGWYETDFKEKSSEKKQTSSSQSSQKTEEKAPKQKEKPASTESNPKTS